ncbi:MAG: hypothetical protein DLM61_18195 [Pseudonocardiales bacterium]|nr:MAG: hypothetical protein DLM61_18195 [Pseudonocardiales bacterium]
MWTLPGPARHRHTQQTPPVGWGRCTGQRALLSQLSRQAFGRRQLANQRTVADTAAAPDQRGDRQTDFLSHLLGLVAEVYKDLAHAVADGRSPASKSATILRPTANHSALPHHEFHRELIDLQA